MWIMTSFGILMPADRTAYTPEGDPRTMQIRSRRARELDILRNLYLPELGETIHTPTFDYNYRAYCTPEQFAEATAKMVLDIDYEKFKPTTDRFNDDDLHSVYNTMWGTVTRLGTPWEANKGVDPGFSDWYGGGRASSQSSNDRGETKGKRGSRRGRKSSRRGKSGNGSASTAHYGDRYAQATLDMDELDSILDGTPSEADLADQSFWERYDAFAAVPEQRLDVSDALAVHSDD